MVNQRLTGPPLDTAVEVVRWLGAVQAQEYAEALWSLALRSRDRSAVAVEAAFDRGEFLRTHLLRPTWHFVAREDIRDLLRVTGPRVHQVNRYSYRQFGLDAATLTRGHELLAGLLADGPLTRPEIARHADRVGLPAKGLPLGYLLMYAELEQLICSGPRRGKQQTYALLDDRAPSTDERRLEHCTDDLVLRYFRSRGPATIRDFTTWSGLTSTSSRESLARVAERLGTWTAADGTPWYGHPDQPTPTESTAAYLIPMYDELGIGYRDLRMVLHPDGAPPFPLERPVVVGGRTVGTWRRTLTATKVTVEVALFRALTRAEADALDAAVIRFGEHLGLPATLSIAPG